jgi:hypothetical protein
MYQNLIANKFSMLLIKNDKRHGTLFLCSFAAMPQSARDWLSQRETRGYKKVNMARECSLGTPVLNMRKMA